ncbi:hypothetical protein Pma05_82000 [Plantactinospora mayteni]|uniref:Transposase DDE domain-containing protein n=1 Tax=Plantactinospora mayteni TaxID=566021 RepID=A0ABQ4F409_9ACTN|nr:hypothetical protein Pma05_82000 [Plantactinospora mayteni]
MVGHAGARLLTDVADVTGLTAAFGEALAGLRQRQGGHEPGRVAADLAVMIADGGEAIADLAVLRDQAELFGVVASDPTAWRLLSGMDGEALAQVRTARARAREVAWAQTCETRGGLPAATASGLPIPGLVLDLDASIVICHSEKESATRNPPASGPRSNAIHCGSTAQDRLKLIVTGGFHDQRVRGSSCAVTRSGNAARQ